jgi:hypothetical protein
LIWDRTHGGRIGPSTFQHSRDKRGHFVRIPELLKLEENIGRPFIEA